MAKISTLAARPITQHVTPSGTTYVLRSDGTVLRRYRTPGSTFTVFARFNAGYLPINRRAVHAFRGLMETCSRQPEV